MFGSTKSGLSSKRNDSILGRLAYLLSAQAVEGVLSTVFFLSLAWINATNYGQIMYAMAAGSVIQTIIQFGLYYPLVSKLGNVDESETKGLILGVQIIKIALFALCFVGVLIFAWRQQLSAELSAVLALISAGFSVEALAETFFAGLRVSGNQNVEARIKVAGSIASYGYGFISAAVGLGPVYVSLFKLISGITRIIFGFQIFLKSRVRTGVLSGAWVSVGPMFKASLVFALIEILGVVYNKANIFFLQEHTGVSGVAYYSATYNILEAISLLGSEQFLGWVIFPLLATLWWKDRKRAGELVRRNAQWLMAIAFPVIFFLYAESALIIGVIYPAEYVDAVWMQKYLAWTIVVSFENNLFSYVMIVAGAANMLLIFQIAGTVVNFVLNFTLVPILKLEGGCFVIIFTKLFIVTLTFTYCRLSFGFVRVKDFLFPITLGLTSFGLFLFSKPLISLHPAVASTIIFYLAILFSIGPKFIGFFPKRVN